MVAKFSKNKMRRWLFPCLSVASVLAVRCSQVHETSDPDAVSEGSSFYKARVATTSAPAPATAKDTLTKSLDVRGVGDTGLNMSGLGRAEPLWRGDLAFVNFETVVSSNCPSPNTGVDFMFRTDPSQVRTAFQQGFNIFSLANNHSRDCFQPYGPSITAKNMNALAGELGLLWNGTSETDPYQAKVQTFTIKGHKVRVAFGAMTIQSWSMKGVAEIVIGQETAQKADVQRLLKSLQTADADFRMLSIHTQDSSGNGRSEGPAFLMLKTVAQMFITKFNGNIVYGSGPHTEAGVKVVQRADGSRGVIFTSLGNFFHDGLSAHNDNYLGRALFDFEHKNQLQAVQVFPLSNLIGPVIKFHMNAKAPLSNFDWSKGSTSYYANFAN